jgi:Fe-S-cluster-containing dehydrogenase component
VHRLPPLRGRLPLRRPQFDPVDNLVKKCNMCVDEIDAGRKPYCVMACMMRVLDIGPIDQLRRLDEHQGNGQG